MGVAARFAIPAVITEWLFSINWVSRVHRGHVDSYGRSLEWADFVGGR